MQTPSFLAAATFGLTLAAIVVVACSDDAPGSPDAAGCACPPAEPPLAGRIITERGTVLIGANDTGAIGAGCPSGATILGGGCYVEGNGDRRIVLNRAGFDRRVPQLLVYQCNFTSTAPIEHVIVAEAVCLMPAE